MKKMIKYIGIMFAFIFGLFVVSNNEVKAIKFDADSTSEVTINEGQMLFNSSGDTFLIMSGTYNNFIVSFNYINTTPFNNNLMALHCYKNANSNYAECYKMFSINGSSYTTEYSLNVSSNNRMITLFDYVVTSQEFYFYIKDYYFDITTDNQAYAEQYITDNNYHTNEDYLNYGNTKYTEGYNDRDITTDNQEYANQYITDNNYHTNEDYLNYGNTKYAQGVNDGSNGVDITIDNQDAINNYCNSNVCRTNAEYQIDINNAKQEGINSVDITTDNQEYAEQYITDNNYHTNEDYLNYGNTKYTEGYNDRDITTDNQEYANKYITDNNYHTNEDYLNYGNSKYQESYYNTTLNNIDVIANHYKYLFPNETVAPIYICDNLTSGGVNCDIAIKSYLDTIYIISKTEGYSYLLNDLISTLKNNNYDMPGQYLESHITLANSQNINIYSYNQGNIELENINSLNQKAFIDTMPLVENKGYIDAMEDSDAFLGLIPTTLGAVISNVMPILTYEVYGISLMNLIGLIAIIGIAIVIIKFIVG